MHQLQTLRSPAHLAEAHDALTAGEPLVLTLTEVEKAQAEAAGAVVNHAHEGTTASVLKLRQLNLAAHDRFLAGTQRSDRTQARAVLVTQGQMEQQVLQRFDAERRKSLGDAWADTA